MGSSRDPQGHGGKKSRPWFPNQQVSWLGILHPITQSIPLLPETVLHNLSQSSTTWAVYHHWALLYHMVPPTQAPIYHLGKSSITMAMLHHPRQSSTSWGSPQQPRTVFHQPSSHLPPREILYHQGSALPPGIVLHHLTQSPTTCGNPPPTDLSSTTGHSSNIQGTPLPTRSTSPLSGAVLPGGALLYLPGTTPLYRALLH